MTEIDYVRHVLIADKVFGEDRDLEHGLHFEVGYSQHGKVFMLDSEGHTVLVTGETGRGFTAQTLSYDEMVKLHKTIGELLTIAAGLDDAA